MRSAQSINWRVVWKRFIWTAIFAAMMGLLIMMSKDMADTQPVIFGIVILAAIVGSVGFVYARENKAALAVAILAVSVHAFFEASYWSSVIEDINGQVVREQAATEARAIVAEKRRERYSSSAGTRSSAQIAAEIEAVKQNERWASSAECTKATATESRKFCADYYRLVADLAASKEAASLEAVVWTSGTNVEVPDIKRNLAKGAILFADLTGLSVRDATNILVIIVVTFTQAVLAFSLMIGYEPERLREARTAAFAPEGSNVALKVFPPVQPRTPLPEAPKRPDLERKTPVEPDAPPPGDAAPTPRAPIVPTIEPQVRKPELATDGGKRLTKGEKKRRAAEKAERGANERIAAVEAFVDQCLDAAPLIRVKGRSPQGGTKGEALRKEFRQWASTQQEWQHLATVDDSYLGRAFTAVIDAGRNANGALYGAVMKVKQPVRRAA